MVVGLFRVLVLMLIMVLFSSTFDISSRRVCFQLSARVGSVTLLLLSENA